ncbi:MAG: serine hydrolase [Phycisphaerae bacterium]|nr:serine hydrolase [Phycisphaerae bacterium]
MGTLRLRLLALAGVSALLASGLSATEPPEVKPAEVRPAVVTLRPLDPSAPDFQARCVAAADYSAKHAGRVVLIMHKGRVVFERGDNGWPVDRPHPLASGTKSFTGVAAMYAVQDGLLTLDELACDTLTEWKSDPRKSRITVRQLLTLSSGLDPSDDLLGGRGGGLLLGPGIGRRGEPQSRDRKDEPGNLFASAVGVPAVGEPGSKFEYGPSHFYAFGELLRRKLEKSDLPEKTVQAYYEARVFKPLGLTFRVGKDKAGNPKLPGGAVLSAKEWGTFGQFVLQKGAWGKELGGPEADSGAKPGPTQLLKAELLAECFKPSKANPSYGLTWWLLADSGAGAEADGPKATGQPMRDRIRERYFKAESKGIVGPDGKPITVFMAAGLGKQRLYVLPQFDLVVVRFAESSREGLGFKNDEFLGALLR